MTRWNSMKMKKKKEEMTMKTDTTDLLIQTWEQGLRENSMKPLSPVFFSYSKEQNHEEACALFRYVFEKILGWSPYDVINYLNYDIIDKLNLKKAFSNLSYPPEYKDRRCACFYVGVLCYPEIIRDFRKTNVWIMEYNNILHKGRGYYVTFEKDTGYDKARFLLNYYLVNNPDPRFTDLETAYAFFASSDAEPFLKSIKLWSPCEQFFMSPLEYFHMSLPDDTDEDTSRSDLTLQFTEFKQLNGEIAVSKGQAKMESEGSDSLIPTGKTVGLR